MKKTITSFIILILCSNNVFASSVSQKKPYPYNQGIALAKNFLYLNARELSAGAGLNTFWSDTLKDNSQINSGASSGYTYRGSTNFDVIVNSTQLDKMPDMSSNSAPTGNIYSSSETNGAAWNAATDNATTSLWITGAGSSGWWAYDFGSGVTKTAVKYTIQGGTTGDDVTRNPKTWTFQGSNDSTNGSNGTWTTLDTQTNVAAWTSAEIRTYTFSNTTPYRWYKFNISANQGGGFLHAAEFEIMEAASTTAVIQSVTTTMASTVSELIVFCEVTLNSGSISSIRVSANGGSTWKTLATTDLEKIISLGHSGTSVILEISITGNAELEFWGVAA